MDGLNLKKVHLAAPLHPISDAIYGSFTPTALKPFQTFYVVGKPANINLQGYRAVGGRDSFMPGNANEYRIAIIGSSNEFGWGVNEEEIFPYLIEKRLNEIKPIKKTFRVINLSMPDRNYIDYLYSLIHEVPLYKPDLILVTAALDSMALHDSFVNGPPEVRREVAVKLKVPFLELLIKKQYRYLSRQFTFISLFTRRLRTDMEFFRQLKNVLGLYTANFDYFGSEKQKQAIGWFVSQLAKYRGQTPLVVFTLKNTSYSHTETPLDLDNVIRHLHASAASNQIPVIDTFRYRMGGTPAEMRITYDEPHPNSRTHA